MKSGGGSGTAAAGSVVVDLCLLLPEDCIANVLSLTSPRDACRLSLVASTFRAAAESDVVWERFLPRDYKDIIARTVDPSPFPPLPFTSKKQLYLWLSDHPLITDQGTKSFLLEKWSGKRCYILAARNLTIVWSDTPTYWRWISLPESRFSEVAEVINVCWLEIRGNISTSMMSPKTTYGVYLLFKSSATAHGFEYQPAEVTVGISGGESETRTVYLGPEGGHNWQYDVLPRRIGIFNRSLINSFSSNVFRPHAHIARERERERNDQYPKVRRDGWMEIELGEYFNDGGEDRELEMSLMEVKDGNWKTGLIVEGIEIRPNEGK